MDSKRARDINYRSKNSTPYEGEIITSAMRVRKAMSSANNAKKIQVLSNPTVLKSSMTTISTAQQRVLQQTKLDVFFNPGTKRKFAAESEDVRVE